MNNNNLFDFEILYKIQREFYKLIYSHEPAKLQFSLNQFESATDFGNQVGSLLLNIGAEIYNPKEYKFIMLDLEFHNEKVTLEKIFCYPIDGKFTVLEEAFEELKSTGVENFVLIVI